MGQQCICALLGDKDYKQLLLMIYNVLLLDTLICMCNYYGTDTYIYIYIITASLHIYFDVLGMIQKINFFFF
jgi:hypothetical protein